MCEKLLENRVGQSLDVGDELVVGLVVGLGNYIGQFLEIEKLVLLDLLVQLLPIFFLGAVEAQLADQLTDLSSESQFCQRIWDRWLFSFFFLV